MVLVRPQVIAAMVDPKPASRPEMSVSGLQLVSRGGVIWARKAIWRRNTPYTVGPYAHTGQLEIRTKFGDAAHQALGAVGLVDTKYGPLPPACKEVIDKVSGFRAPHRIDPAKYPSKLRRTAYTLAELKKILAARA